MPKLFEIHWKNPEAGGATDMIPAELFSHNGKIERVTHRMRWPNGQRYAVLCSINVRGSAADIFYSQSEADRIDIWPGTARILFETDERKAIKEVQWADPGEEFQILNPAPSTALIEDGAQDEVIRASRLANISSRPAQVEFSLKLRELYNNECAVTGCTTPQSLEAAHIQTYEKSKSGKKDNNSLDNGILLRADIHALFDAGLIALSADGTKIETSSLLTDEGYIDLKDRAVKIPFHSRPSSQNIAAHRERFRF